MVEIRDLDGGYFVEEKKVLGCKSMKVVVMM